MTSPGHFEKLDPDECWSLLDTTTVGRLGFDSPDGIVIVPVNFVPFDRAIFLRTEPGSIIARVADGMDGVAFEVDHHEDLFQRGWSVLLRGATARADDAEAARAYASTPRLGPWAPGDRSLVVKFEPHLVEGRRIARG